MSGQWSPARIELREAGPARLVRWIGNERLRCQLPFNQDNRARLKEWLGPRTRSEYIRAEHSYWAVAKPHFPKLLVALASNYQHVKVALAYSTRERCHRLCQDARPESSWQCECSCGGRWHGGGSPPEGWQPIGEVLISQGEVEVRRVDIYSVEQARALLAGRIR